MIPALLWKQCTGRATESISTKGALTYRHIKWQGTVVFFCVARRIACAREWSTLGTIRAVGEVTSRAWIVQPWLTRPPKLVSLEHSLSAPYLSHKARSRRISRARPRVWSNNGPYWRALRRWIRCSVEWSLARTRSCGWLNLSHANYL